MLVDSGGAATAIYDFCTAGIDAVEPKFRGKEAILQTIKLLNDAYKQRQLTFYRLSDEGKGFGDRMQEMSSCLLDGIFKMMNSPPLYAMLPAGAAFKHPDFGFGTVTEVSEDNSSRTVTFESGMRHHARDQKPPVAWRPGLGLPGGSVLGAWASLGVLRDTHAICYRRRTGNRLARTTYGSSCQSCRRRRERTASRLSAGRSAAAQRRRWGAATRSLSWASRR